jgi:hypothetical protein
MLLWAMGPRVVQAEAAVRSAVAAHGTAGKMGLVLADMG